MKQQLARLTEVDLREVWGHEALDFTIWLALEENIDLLSEAIGIDIKPIQTEAGVGRFNVDLLAEEEGTGRKIIIENQLENTDHDHLGKIITYASGYDAEIIIWIVREVRDEHQKAIEWLNEHTDENISLFLLKIKLWKIEGSNPAPKFEIIVSPNQWAKVIKTAQTNNTLTDTKLTQLEFWNKFKEYVLSTNKKIRLQTPRPQHWYDITIGSSDAHLSLTFNTRDNLVSCELYISRSKDLFNFLSERRSEIETEIGEEADWIDAPTASRIKIKKNVSNCFNQNEWEEQFRWLLAKTVLFRTVFIKYLKDLKRTIR
jgi:hypothetical protein